MPVACAAVANGGATRGESCACGVTAAPALNTGFVWARAGADGAAVAQLFNGTVHTILSRLREPTPVRT